VFQLVPSLLSMNINTIIALVFGDKGRPILLLDDQVRNWTYNFFFNKVSYATNVLYETCVIEDSQVSRGLYIFGYLICKVNLNAFHSSEIKLILTYLFIKGSDSVNII
jgi:hypothetical protein